MNIETALYKLGEFFIDENSTKGLTMNFPTVKKIRTVTLDTFFEFIGF
jgi:hypothetical protein